MKKVLLAAIGLFSFITAVNAQEKTESRQVLSIGPSVGFGHTGLLNVGGMNSVFKPSWNAGIILNYSKMAHVGFAAELLYSVEGGRFDNSERETDINLQYIRLPLKFAYFFMDPENNFRPKITVGPSFGYLLDARNDINSKGTSAANEGTTNVTSAFNKFDIGLNASVGFNWKLASNIWLNTDLYYYNGFIDVDDANHFNMNFGLKVGVAFGL